MNEFYSPVDTAVILAQVWLSIEHCAQMLVAHRDIKPDNFLYDPQSGLVQLADFGAAKILDADEEHSTTYRVTRYYRPPEIIHDNTAYQCSVDWWGGECAACFTYDAVLGGCIMAELMFCHVLWQGENTMKQWRLIVQTLGTPDDNQWEVQYPHSYCIYAN